MLIKHLKDYDRTKFRCDFLAGLTVAVMLIPQGMAYGMLAGLPPIYGLYAGLIPLLIYPIFGTSKYLSVGPVALVSIIMVAGLSQFAAPLSPEFISLAILTSIVAGGIQMILSFLRMGFLVNFLSHPVMAGFTSAAAIIIAISQLKHIFGVHTERTSSIFVTLKQLANQINDANLISVGLGVAGIAIIIFLKKINRSIPGALMVVALGILVVYFADLAAQNVQIIGDVNAGLPTFMMPDFSFENIKKVFPLALIICLISFIESLSIAKTLAAKQEDFSIDANKELLSLGLAKVVGGFFQAFPNTGSFSRSAINEQSGAKTGLSSIFAAIIVGLVLLFLTNLVYYIPNAILAAIVISAVLGLIDFKMGMRLFRTDKRDFIIFITTFVLTLILGVQNGVLSGVVLSLILIIDRIYKPHWALLGKLPDSKHYRNIKRFKKGYQHENRIILRYDGDLFFGNVDHFYNTVKTLIQQNAEASTLILNLTAVHRPDSTGVEKLIQLMQECRRLEIDVYLTDVKGPVRDMFETTDMYHYIHRKNVFLSVEEACAHLDERNN